MEIDTLLAERDIYRNLSLFARAMDLRDWAALTAIMSEDIVADLGTGPLHGPDAVIANLRSFLDDCGPTQHLLGNVLIDINGDEATSQAYVNDMHVGSGDKADLTFRTLGDYHDRWIKRDGRWRMVQRTKHNHAIIGSIEVLGQGPASWRAQ